MAVARYLTTEPFQGRTAAQAVVVMPKKKAVNGMVCECMVMSALGAAALMENAATKSVTLAHQIDLLIHLDA